MHDAAEPTAVFTRNDALLAGALHVQHRMHIQHTLAVLVRQHLVNLHRHRVRQLVLQARQRGLAD